MNYYYITFKKHQPYSNNIVLTLNMHLYFRRLCESNENLYNILQGILIYAYLQFFHQFAQNKHYINQI